MDMVIGLVWIMGTILNCYIAKEKNRGSGAIAILSLLLTPIVIYLYLLAVPKKTTIGHVSQTKDITENKEKEHKNIDKCSNCGYDNIKKDDRFCGGCGLSLKAE